MVKSFTRQKANIIVQNQEIRHNQDFIRFSLIQYMFLEYFWWCSQVIFPKVEFSWNLESGHEFKLFPANIWIFKLVFLMVFAIKMLLDYTYWLLNLLEFKCNHFNSLSLAEFKFKNSNVGGKQLEFMSWLQISEKTAFSI